MKILQLHSDFIKYKPIKKEIDLAEDVEKKEYTFEDILVLFIAIEKGDDIKVGKRAIGEIGNFIKKIKCDKILLYPFSHLSSELAGPLEAKEILNFMYEYAKGLNIKVFRAPFGWTKKFSISIKGYPLAEQLRTFAPKMEEKVRPKVEKSYLILTPKGELIPPEKYKFKKSEKEFKALVEKEALGIESKARSEPEYIKHIKKFGFNWEAWSDLGHMRFGPEASLILDLIAEYSLQLAQKLKIPVYSLKGSNIFSLDQRPIAQHAQLFPERMYKLVIDGREFLLRYAACFQQFAIIKDWQISYKHLPFGAFDIADSYRFELPGELLLSFRLRKMTMPDFHVFSRDLNEGKSYFLKLHKIIYDEIEKLGRNYVSLYNLTSKKFLEENKEWFLKLVRREKKPVLLCFYPEGIEFYWVLNIEYHIIDKMGRPREIATAQIDIGNAKRFGISYIDAKGEKIHPIILHTAILGTLERWIYTLFDTALREKNPSLPSWLSPTQVRLIPLSDKYIKFAEKIADEIEKNRIRVDIDNRAESVPKKIREAEIGWIPFSIVIGEKEIKSKKLSVRIRKTGEIKQMKVENLIKLIKEETQDKPFKPLLLPRLLSKRPIFSK